MTTRTPAHSRFGGWVMKDGSTYQREADSGDHEYVVGLSMLRCSECGDLLDDGICENHGRLDDGREGQPEFNGAFR